MLAGIAWISCHVGARSLVRSQVPLSWSVPHPNTRRRAVRIRCGLRSSPQPRRPRGDQADRSEGLDRHGPNSIERERCRRACSSSHSMRRTALGSFNGSGDSSRLRRRWNVIPGDQDLFVLFLPDAHLASFAAGEMTGELADRRMRERQAELRWLGPGGRDDQLGDQSRRDLAGTAIRPTRVQSSHLLPKSFSCGRSRGPDPERSARVGRSQPRRSAAGRGQHAP